LRELRLLLDGTWDDFEILAKEVAVVAVSIFSMIIRYASPEAEFYYLFFN